MVKFRMFFQKISLLLPDAQKEFPGTPFWEHEGVEMLQMEGGIVKGKKNRREEHQNLKRMQCLLAYFVP